MNQPNPLTLENAKDIARTLMNAFVVKDEILLITTATQAANFIEAWIQLETQKLLDAVKEPSL